MRIQLVAAMAMSMFLTAANPVWAQDAGTSRTRIEESGPQRLSDLGMAWNPQLGVSSFEYSEGGDGGSQPKLSGGVTFEFGGKADRKIETGLLLLQTGSSGIDSSYLTIPMMAKLRVAKLRAQTWYGKFGFMPAFEVASSDDGATNNIDVITSLGMGGRFPFDRKSDFILEATYNRGLLDSLKGTTGQAYNQGFLVMAGLSFNL
jgi:hypothetical protein